MKAILFAVTAALGLAYARLVGGPMDGTSWDVKLRRDGIFAFSHHETLIFEKGRFSVVGADDASEFPPSVYTSENLDSDAGDSVWNAALTREDKGVVTWHGLVRGDQIEGVAVWWTRDGKPRRFTFKGSRRA